MRNFKYFVDVLILFSLIVYCSDVGVSPDQRKYIIPEKDISYYDDLLPMLEGKCGFECHSEIAEILIPFLDKDDFIDYQISVTGDVLVDTLLHKIDPTRAPLYRIVTEIDYLGIETMPPFPRSPLTDNQIIGIRQWIAEGARD